MANQKDTADYFPFYVKQGRTLFLLQHKFGLVGIGFFTQVMRTLTATPGHILDLSSETDRLYSIAMLGAEDEEASAMLDLMSQTGKIDKALWTEKHVIYSQDLVNSLAPLYEKRKSKPAAYSEVLSRFGLASQEHSGDIPELPGDIQGSLRGRNRTKERKEEERRGEETPPAAAWRNGIAREAGLDPSSLSTEPSLNDILSGIDPSLITYFFENWRRYWFAIKRSDRDRPEEKRLPDFNPQLFAHNINAVAVDMAVAKQAKSRYWKSDTEQVSDEERDQVAEKVRALAERLSGGTSGRDNPSVVEPSGAQRPALA